MLCGECRKKGTRSENWKREYETIEMESKKWPITKIKVELRRLECEVCGNTSYWADLADDSMFPEEIKK